MTQLQPTPRATSASPATANPNGAEDSLLVAVTRRLATLETLVRRIEDELSDTTIEDEQRLQNIGERIAGVLDGA